MTKGEKNVRTNVFMFVLTCLGCLNIDVDVFMVVLDWIFGFGCLLKQCLDILRNKGIA